MDKGKRSTGKPVSLKQGYHHGDLKEALVQAATALVAKTGPRGFSLSQACRLANVSPSAFYRHFTEKDALLAEVARRGFDDLTTRLQASRTDHCTSCAERLLAMATAYVEFSRSNPAIFRIMFASGIEKLKYEELRASAGNAFEQLLEEIQIAQNEQLLYPGDSEQFAMTVWSTAHGVAMLAVDSAKDERFSDLSIASVQAILKPTIDGLISDKR